MGTYDLLIAFTGGWKKTVSGVSEYGYKSDTNMFYFINADNLYKTFIPRENVMIFGRKSDLEKEKKNDNA